MQKLLCSLCLLWFIAFNTQADTYSSAPETPNPEDKYLFYLHGSAEEEDGEGECQAEKTQRVFDPRERIVRLNPIEPGVREQQVRAQCRQHAKQCDEPVHPLERFVG